MPSQRASGGGKARRALSSTAFNPVIKQNGDHKFFTSGLASRADNRPVTPDTLFEIGSISKVFTVTLAALAEERGILNLKNSAAHYLCSDACALGDNLTLMDLATHHSGGLPLNAPDNISDVNSVVNWLKGWHPPQPGTRSYSNVSIGILGYITGKAMGSNYAEAAQTVLFPAFGLNNTWIQVPQKQMGQYAFGYDKETNEPIRLESAVLDADWRRGMVEIVGHSQTNARDNREPKLRPKPARQSSTLPMSGMWKRSHGGTIKAPPDESGGNRYVPPNATAPHLDSTNRVILTVRRPLPVFPDERTSLDRPLFPNGG
jgi:CubicO group peptidase (beta-lactamase class C family)